MFKKNKRKITWSSASGDISWAYISVPGWAKVYAWFVFRSILICLNIFREKNKKNSIQNKIKDNKQNQREKELEEQNRRLKGELEEQNRRIKGELVAQNKKLLELEVRY